MNNETIDLTPFWEAHLRMLIALVQDGNSEGKKAAIEELKRMARAADHAAKFYPKKYDNPTELTIEVAKVIVDDYINYAYQYAHEMCGTSRGDEAPEQHFTRNELQEQLAKGMVIQVNQNITALIAGHFWIDLYKGKDSYYAGYRQVGNLWNGWERPYFTKEVTEAIVADFMRGAEEGSYMKFDGGNIRYKGNPEDEEEVIVPFTKNDLTLYEIGNGWTWQRAEVKEGFIVLALCGNSGDPVFREDENLMIFDTVEAAEAEIQECLKDVKEAVKKGDMQGEYSRDEYEIVPAILTNTIVRFIYEGSKYTMNRDDDTVMQVN